MSIKVQVSGTTQEFNFSWLFMNKLKLKLTLDSGVIWKVLLDGRGVKLTPKLPCPVQKYIVDTWYKWEMIITSPRGPVVSLESGYMLAEGEANISSAFGETSPTCTITIPSYMQGIGFEEETKVTMVCRSYVLITQLLGCNGFTEATTSYANMFLPTRRRKTCVLRRTN